MIRENWRIVLLTLLTVVSAVVLFVPGTPPGAPSDGAGATNLQYGIQLDGGSRIQAPIVGTTAEGVNVSADAATDLEVAVSNRLSLDQIDVRVAPTDRDGLGTVEVFSRDVADDELRAAIEAEGYTPETIRGGVTQATRQDVVEVVRQKITTSALSGGSVTTIRTPDNQRFVSIEAPDRDLGELRSLLDDRGVVRVYVFYPAQNGSYLRQQVLSQDAFASIGNARQIQGQPGVSVTVSEAVAQGFAGEMTRLGFGQGTTCDPNYDNPFNASGRCIAATLNGNVTFMGGVRPDLGSSFSDGSFAEDPTFTMSTTSIEEAREVEISLKSGRLPAPLDFRNDRSTSLEPALAEQFRSNSVIVGLAAVLAVSLVVYVRYGDPRVAAPMIVTALSEVFLLLGFVAFVQYPLNLSHIAGFIAVIGTGVDDLVIIADEILQREDVTTGRVFQSRFRKAFWVIGAAAATTVLAMSPLTVLALGDLSGFAVVTIVGVLIGVLITRPAYGNILRNLILDE